jgi:hypothetical protein
MDRLQTPRKYARSNSRWPSLVPPEADTGERWIVIWDTRERPSIGSRNKAVEKSESDAVERVRRFLSMGFFVYELRGPSGSILLDETGIKQQIGERRVAK